MNFDFDSFFGSLIIVVSKILDFFNSINFRIAGKNYGVFFLLVAFMIFEYFLYGFYDGGDD